MNKPKTSEDQAAQAVAKLTRSQQRMKARAEHKGQKKTDAAAAKPSIFVRGYNFFLEAKQELGRVVWPTRSETFKSTGVLLVLVGIVGLYLGIIDGILTKLLSFLV